MENCGSPYFDKDTTNILKGIALIMMFLHHFFTFPEWWTDGISYPSIEKLIPYFRSPLKLCVPVFCFLTGYLYFFGKNKSFKYSFKKITDILIAYWSVFFIFAIIAAVLVDYKYTPTNFVKECFALYRPTMYFCWYVMFYIPLMALLPLIKKFMLKNIHIDLIITFLLIPLTLKYIERCVHNDIIGHLLSYFEEWLPIVLTGCIFAGYDLFEKTYNLNTKITKNKALNITLYLLLAFASPMGRWAEPEIALSFDRLPDFKINTDALYTPVFIYAVVNLCTLIDFKAVKFIYRMGIDTLLYSGLYFKLRNKSNSKFKK